MFVESHVGQYLDARRDGGGRMLGQLHRVVQDTVDAVANEERFFERFDVNIRCSLRTRVTKEGIYNAHGWYAFGKHADVLLFSVADNFFKRDCFTLYDIAEIVFESLLVLLEGVFDARRISEARKHFEVRLLLDEINRREVVGIEHRHFELVAAVAVRDDVVAPRDGLRDERERLVLDVGPRQGDEWNAEDVRIGAAQFVLPYRIARRENVADRLPRLFRFRFRQIKIFLAHQPRVGEERFEVCVGDVHIGRC